MGSGGRDERERGRQGEGRGRGGQRRTAGGLLHTHLQSTASMGLNATLPIKAHSSIWVPAFFGKGKVGFLKRDRSWSRLGPRKPLGIQNQLPLESCLQSTPQEIKENEECISTEELLCLDSKASNVPSRFADGEGIQRDTKPWQREVRLPNENALHARVDSSLLE